MSKNLTLHLINKQLKVWEYEFETMATGDRIWTDMVTAKIRKLKAKRERFLFGSKLKPLDEINIPYTKAEQTEFRIQKEIDKWLERNEMIETM